MKKVLVFSIFSFVTIISANAQCNGGKCYAYGHPRSYSKGSTTDQKPLSPKDEVDQKKDADKQADKKETISEKKKYNAAEFKTKRYFFKSL